jgi:hypothetical protein
VLGWGASGGGKSSYFPLSTGGQGGVHASCLLPSSGDGSGFLSPVPQPLEADLTSTIKVNERSESSVCSVMGLYEFAFSHRRDSLELPGLGLCPPNFYWPINKIRCSGPTRNIWYPGPNEPHWLES